jgi:hypothetical protein
MHDVVCLCGFRLESAGAEQGMQHVRGRAPTLREVTKGALRTQ